MRKWFVIIRKFCSAIGKVENDSGLINGFLEEVGTELFRNVL